MEQTNKQSGRIIAIIAMMFIYAMISFVTNLAAPIGVIWKNQPELMGSNTLGMMGNMMNFLAYLFMGIPAGKLLIKIGYKKTAMVPIAVGFVGVLVQYLSGFPTGLTGFWVYLWVHSYAVSLYVCSTQWLTPCSTSLAEAATVATSSTLSEERSTRLPER